MDFKYRKLLLQEAEDFWNMMNELDNETKFMLYEPGEREKNKNIPLLTKTIERSITGDDFLTVAECNGKMAGYIWAQKGSLSRILHTAYIVVGVLENYRGKGIGTEFFKRLDQWAEEKQVTRLELTVMCPNTFAKRLYEKSGFAVEGIRKNSMHVDGEFVDEYYMAKVL